MRPELRCRLGLAVVLLSLAAQASAEDAADAAQEITRRETLYSQSFVTGDVAAADQILAEGYIGLMGPGGRPMDKAAMLNEVGRLPHQASARIISLVVHPYGDTAVALGTEDDRDAGARRARRHVWLDTWRRTSDGWRMIASAEVTPPPTPLAPRRRHPRS
jgi:hypothetical protein